MGKRCDLWGKKKASNGRANLRIGLRCKQSSRNTGSIWENTIFRCGSSGWFWMVLVPRTHYPMLNTSWFNKHAPFAPSGSTLCLSPPCSLPQEADLCGLYQQAPTPSDSHLGSANRALAEDQREGGEGGQCASCPGSISARSHWIGHVLQLKVSGSYPRPSHKPLILSFRVLATTPSPHPFTLAL